MTVRVEKMLKRKKMVCRVERQAKTTARQTTKKWKIKWNKSKTINGNVCNGRTKCSSWSVIFKAIGDGRIYIHYMCNNKSTIVRLTSAMKINKIKWNEAYQQAHHTPNTHTRNENWPILVKCLSGALIINAIIVRWNNWEISYHQNGYFTFFYANNL